MGVPRGTLAFDFPLIEGHWERWDFDDYPQFSCEPG